MKWRDPQTTHCPGCGGRFPVRVAALRSLQASCPGCGASLEAVRERMLAEEKRIGREIDCVRVAYELDELTGLVVLDDGEFDAARPLGDLVRIVARLLPPAADREERAAQLVTTAVYRHAPALLSELPAAFQSSAWWAAVYAEPDAAADCGSG